MSVPAAPHPPRTVEQLGAWALTAERAARQTERARAACADDYARLRAWIGTTQVKPGCVAFHRTAPAGITVFAP